MGVGFIHGRRDVATHQRRPFVKDQWLERYKLVKSVTGPRRARPLMLFDLSAIYERTSLRASRTARNNLGISPAEKELSCPATVLSIDFPVLLAHYRRDKR